MGDLPFVSIIIPSRNEKKFIGKCLDSIIAQYYPKDKIEVIVVDGMSEDKTREIIKKYVEHYSFIKMLNNPRKIVPAALNIGIQHAKGEIIIRMDAHTVYNNDYVQKCVEYLLKYNIDNVGGIWKTRPGEDSVIARSIAFALSHPFGVGNSHFRIGSSKPRLVDTVPFGCYRKEIFNEIGYFNENLVRNQDIEFNRRLKKAGKKTLLAPDIISYYYARSTLKNLAKNNLWNGFWVIYSNRFASMPFSARHLVPFIFILILISSFALSFFSELFLYTFILSAVTYLTVNSFFSLYISLKHGIKYLVPIICAFSILHLSYGIGSLWGLIKLASSYRYGLIIKKIYESLLFL